MNETETVKKPTKKTNVLTQTQLSHALNRLQTIFKAKSTPLSSTTWQHAVDWTSEKALAAFVKKHKLEPLFGHELGMYLFGGRSLNDKKYKAYSEALKVEFDESRKGSSGRLDRMNAALAVAQDQLIFSKVSPEQVPPLLEQFEEKLTELHSS